MGNIREWLFRLLVLAAGGLLLLSWFMPWWAADISALGPKMLTIRPWGLENRIDPSWAGFVSGAEMPGWFAPLMWAFLGLAIAVLLVSLFIKNKEVKFWRLRFNLPSLTLGLVGFSYIVVAVLAVIVAAIRTGDFYETKLIGTIFVEIGGGGEAGELSSFVTGRLLLGYWLACAAGPLLMGLALARNKIIGRGVNA